MGLASSLCRDALPIDCDGDATEEVAAATPRERHRSDCKPPENLPKNQRDTSASLIATCEHMPVPCVMAMDNLPAKFSTAQADASLMVEAAVSSPGGFGPVCEATPKKQAGACDPDFRFSPLIGESAGGYSPSPNEEWEEEAIEYGAVWQAGSHMPVTEMTSNFNIFTDQALMVDEVMMASSSTSHLATPRAAKGRSVNKVVETTPQFGREIQNLQSTTPQSGSDKRVSLECYLDEMDISPIKSMKPRKPVSSKNSILHLGGMPTTPRKSESLFNTPRSIETCSNPGACSEQLRLCCSTVTGRKCCEAIH